jgi:hypothetical protein
MPDQALRKALLAALRFHEIGNDTPYRLYFAGKGNSGASFGFMQGDLNTGQAVVKNTFQNVLAAERFPPGEIAALVQRLAQHLINSPLTRAEETEVNAALKAQKKLVDQMDVAIAEDVFEDLDLCIGTATANGRKIDPTAQLYVAMWINMTGKPTKLLTWLRGGDPQLRKRIPKAGAVVDTKAIESYLLATDYYTSNPRNFEHMRESVAKGAPLIP